LLLFHNKPQVLLLLAVLVCFQIIGRGCDCKSASGVTGLLLSSGKAAFVEAGLAVRNWSRRDASLRALQIGSQQYLKGFKNTEKVVFAS
jgi:hypothetical protein